MPKLSVQQFDKYVGKTEKQAANMAEKEGMVIRVTNRDGESLMGTCDYRTDRINVSVEDGVITGISGLG